MKINIPKILRPLPLTEYDPAIVNDDGQPVVVHVWVNPPVRTLEEYQALVADSQRLQADVQACPETDTARLRSLIEAMARTGDQLAEWYARLWSQHADEAQRLSADDVRALVTHDTDPALYQWLTRRTWELIGEHRQGAEKKSAARSSISPAAPARANRSLPAS